VLLAMTPAIMDSLGTAKRRRSLQSLNGWSWPEAAIVGVRIHEPKNSCVAKISTSARPSAGDTSLADGMVRDRPWAVLKPTPWWVLGFFVDSAA